MKKYMMVLLVVIVVASFLVVPVLAKGIHTQDVTTKSNAVDGVEFVALLVTITAFFKERFGLRGNVILAVAFVVGIVLWFLPNLYEVFPDSAKWAEHFIEFIKVFLASVGSFDAAVDVGSRIKTSTTS